MNTAALPDQQPTNPVKRKTFEVLTMALRSVLVVILASVLLALRLRKYAWPQEGSILSNAR
jgi:hypothetical protein